MTDRELLALAAKAYGLDIAGWSDGGEPYSSGPGVLYFTHDRSQTHLWNSLNNPGTAQCLATKLNLSITPYPVYEFPKHAVIVEQKRLELPWFNAIEPYGESAGAAVCRAITRCAAEIGKTL
jgi:hypothetical protein